MAYASRDDFDDEERELEAHVLAERAAWLRRWPSHCPFCHGGGGDYDPNMDVTHPCGCVLAGKCPRCSADSDPLRISPRWHCHVCAWTLNQTSAYGSENDAHCP